MSEFISSKDVKTRVSHVCWGCNTIFPKGTEMLAITSADRGNIATAYFCKTCQEIMAEAYEDFRDDGIGLGELAEWKLEKERA